MTERLISFGPNSADFTIEEGDVKPLERLSDSLPEGSEVLISDKLGELTPINGKKVLSIKINGRFDVFEVQQLIRNAINR